MANIVKQLDLNATATKILEGNMPDGVTSADSIILIQDDVMRIYINLLTTVLLQTLPEDAPEDVTAKRIEIFDKVVETVQIYRCGRLNKMLSRLSDAIKDYQIDGSAWPNTKMRNNVFSFINDFWIWSPEDKAEFLVIVETDLDEQVADFEVVEDVQPE